MFNFESMISEFLILARTCDKIRARNRWRQTSGMKFRLTCTLYNSIIPSESPDNDGNPLIFKFQNLVFKYFKFMISKQILIFRLTYVNNSSSHQWNYWKPVIFFRFVDHAEIMISKFLILPRTCDKNRPSHRWNYWKPFILHKYFDHSEIMISKFLILPRMCNKHRPSHAMDSTKTIHFP